MNFLKEGVIIFLRTEPTCGTALFPKIPLRTTRDRPTISSSLTFTMMAAASPQPVPVDVPEQKQFTATGRGATHMTKQVSVRVPEHTVKTQHNLKKETDTRTLEFFFKNIVRIYSRNHISNFSHMFFSL